MVVPGPKKDVDAWLGAIVLLFAGWFSAAAQRARAVVPMAVYQDPESGVRFEYPAVWQRVGAHGEYFAAAVLKPGEEPRVAVGFSPKGNVYQGTNLSSLVFTFAAPVVASEAECRGRLHGDGIGTVRSWDEVIHGVSYEHASGGDAGMCHQQSFEAYAAFRGGRCFLFEADFNTTCAFPDAGRRELTTAEKRALHRHLDGIMQTVTLGK